MILAGANYFRQDAKGIPLRDWPATLIVLGRFASSSSIGIDTGGSIKEADFRGDDKAKHAHDLILWNVLQS
jgi:hypothetical protein